MRIIFLTLFVFLNITNLVFSQPFTGGADLSYVNTIVQNEGIYRDVSGNIVEPFEYFSSRGTQMVRLRLWHTPENIIDFCGNPISSCNLNDVLSAAQKIETLGMGLNISIHFGDYFNDPGWQLMPAAWIGLTHQILIDSIYQYTYDILEALRLQNTIPEIVSIGNETTWGFIDDPGTTDGWTWPEDADKFNAAFNAIDNFNQTWSYNIKKAVHVTEGSAEWIIQEFYLNGISNYDMIGLSYYPFFSSETDLEELGLLISQLINTYDKELMIFETGFVWSENGWADNYANFMNNNGNVLNYPSSRQGQKDFLSDLSLTVYENGGSGIIYWEPAWISSAMCDKWGQGSSYENVTFFDFENNNNALPAFEFFDFCNSLYIYKNTEKKELIVYPNPIVDGEIKINTELFLYSWKLYNSSGQLIKSGKFNNYQHNHVISLNYGLAGIYFLNLILSNRETVIIKIIL